MMLSGLCWLAPQAVQAKSSPTPAAPSVTAIRCPEGSCYNETISGSQTEVDVNTTIDSGTSLPIIVNLNNGQSSDLVDYSLHASIYGTGPAGGGYGTILGFNGYGGTPSDDFPPDPNNVGFPTVTFINGSSVYLSDYAQVTANPATAYPVGYSLNTGGVVYAASYGAAGLDDTNTSPDHQVTMDNYSGGAGGYVGVTLFPGASITANGNGGSETVSGQYLDPTLSGLGAFSFGGDGVSDKSNDVDYAGNGGSGGEVQVYADGTIAMSNSNNTPTYGIYAVSKGGVGANEKNYATGSSGNGGTVNVYLSGQITNSAPDGIGIVAESIGGDSNFDDKNGGGDASGAGDGGPTWVEIQPGGSVDMSGAVGIGAMAVSVAGNADNTFQGTGGSAGLQLDSGASITTAGGAGSLAIGALAISAGSVGDLLPFASGTVNSAYPGQPGDAKISNYGSIDSSGSMAIGAAALSIGGAAIVTNAQSGGASTLGDSGSNPGSFSGQTAEVDNYGSITTLGGSAFGIVALSAGGGGGLLNLESADQSVAYVGSSTTAAGGGNGAAVTVTNDGTITTGDGKGGGNAAIGVVAQSIGGGGGDSGAPAFFVGGNDKAGEGGGDGGSVTYTSDAGSEVATFDTAAIGVLAQSIGGGGGNGANAAGIFVAVGGQGGNGGDGGTVALNIDNGGSGGVHTLGDFGIGVLAQSIGGGGGNGGASTTAGPVISAAIGGGGGSGGNGGGVTVTNDGIVATAGNQAHGIIAQSIGGGGGSGGAANSYSEGAITMSIAVGGDGGSGGSGGAVTVDNNYHIYTGCVNLAGGCAYGATGTSNIGGADSIGILAQSIGGGGGNGGDASATSLSLPSADIPVSVSLDFSIGGSGGTASPGGAVTLNNAGEIYTEGDTAYGIAAQSIGGGGGNGGDSSATAYALEDEGASLKAAVAVGGSGGGGGPGGDISVTNGAYDGCGGCDAQIATFGEDAAGILAQSIGGGGGTGAAGTASDGSPNLGADTGPAIDMTISVGGGGGSGGAGGTVNVANEAGSSIVTAGSGAQGILAQSIGGGGGAAAGGSADSSNDSYEINLGIGGNGGSGNDGGNVTVANAGTIRTGEVLTDAAGAAVGIGGDAVGILAQSIGGGGGVGGSTDPAATIGSTGQLEDLLNPPGTSYSANIGVGGKGGAGGNGGMVAVSNTGSLTTIGIRAFGIEAQSIGGGGGNGGAATSASSGVVGGTTIDPESGDTKGQTYSADVSVGGSGGASGDGGAVSVSNSGMLATYGYGAHGLFAQSIGGGGGVGGEGTANNSTMLGIGAQVGGGGGNGGDAGTVTIANTGSILTLGDDGYGILAQAIGGGGGAGSAGCSNSIAVSPTGQGYSGTACLGNSGGTATLAPWNDAADFTMDIGGNSGAYGNGNTITIGTASAPMTGRITTLGARAFAIAAQSIGGGGGLAAASNVNLSSVSFANGDAGNGGDIDVNTGAGSVITTYSAGAYGMLLQSIGGGGGFGGDSSNGLATPIANYLTAAPINSDRINGGIISLTLAGAITTYGANAHGIFAQSIGGGGGLIGINGVLTAGNDQASGTVAAYGGNGGAITIDQTGGVIIARGAGSIGIFAQSTGNDPDAQQPITVTVGGTVSGGSGAGSAGIYLSGGQSGNGDWTGGGDSITVNAGGTLTSANGVNGVAVATNDAVTRLTNNGTLIGGIDFGSDSDGSSTVASTAVNNGVFDSGASVTAQSLTNNGTLAIGGTGHIATTALSGDFTQNDAGKLAVEVDTQSADLLDISGNAAIAGSVAPVGLGTLLPGTRSFVAAGSLELSATVLQPLLFTWTLGQTGNDATLTPAQNFAAPLGGGVLTSNQNAIANYLASAWNNSDTALAGVFATLSQIPSGGGGALRAQYAAFSANATQGELQALKANEGGIVGASMSCPVYAGTTSLLTEDSCVWVRFGGQSINQYAAGGDSGFATTGTTYRIGGEQAFAPGWFIGGSLGAGSTWTKEGISSSSGTTYDGSIALKRQLGNWLFAGAVALANDSYRNTRVVALPAGRYALTSNANAFMAGGRLRAAYDIPFANGYLRPYADLDIINISTPSFRESGDASYALHVKSSDSTNVVLSPMLELGGRQAIGAGLLLRAFGDFGLSVLPGNNRAVTASLAAADPADGSFATTIRAPSLLGDAALGLQFYRADGFEVRADYNTQIGGDFFAQGGMLKLAYHF